MSSIDEEEQLLKQFDNHIGKVRGRLSEEIRVDVKSIEYLDRIEREINHAIYFLKQLKKLIETQHPNKKLFNDAVIGFKTKLEDIKKLLRAEQMTELKKQGIDTQIRQILDLLERLFSALEKKAPR